MKNEYDFSKAKRTKDVRNLARLQQEARGKTRITIMLDNDVISAFRARAESEGVGCQTLINAALRGAIESHPVDEETLRRVLRDRVEGVVIGGEDALDSTCGGGVEGARPSPCRTRTAMPRPEPRNRYHSAPLGSSARAAGQ